MEHAELMMALVRRHCMQRVGPSSTLQIQRRERTPKFNMPKYIISFALAVALTAALCLGPMGVDAKRTWTSPKLQGQLQGELTKNDPTGLCDTVKSQAGYFKITGSKNKNYFYWFFESRNHPKLTQ